METAISYSTEKLSQTRTVRIEALSPIHVGAASEKLMVHYLDFLWEDEAVHVLDQRKLMHLLIEKEALDRYEKLLLSGKTEGIWDLLDDLDITATDVRKYRIDCPKEPANELRPLVRDGFGRVFLPGSSIKGAIRSALFEHLFRSEKSESEADLLGKFENSIMRFIRPFDGSLDRVGIVHIDLFNLYNNGGNWRSEYKKGFLVSAEVFQKTATGSFRLGLADGLLEAISKKEPRIRPVHASRIFKKEELFENLFAVINAHTRRHVERELAFFKKYPQADDTNFVISNLETVLENTPTDERPSSCVLRMAFGSGFHAITGDWRIEDHTRTVLNPDPRNLTYSQTTRQREPARYKSRKITGMDANASAMGFLKMEI